MLGRRQMIQGLGASALLAPLVGSLARAGEAGAAPRLLVFFTPNEPIDRDHWHPGGSGDEIALDGPLPTMMTPIDPFRDRLLMIGDLEMKTRELDDFGGGHVGMGHMLTGWINEPYGAENYEFWAGGISVDQHVAAALDCEALTLGVLEGGNNGNCRMSYLGKNQPVAPTSRPDEAFDSLFADALLPEDQLAELRARRLSVLDRVVGDLDRAKAMVATSDRDKIDAHLEEVRRLENKIADETALQCEPEAPGEGDYDGNAMLPTTTRRQIDIAVEALACGATQVATLQVGNSGAGNITPLWADEGLDISTDLHTLAHDYNQGGTAQQVADREAVERFFFDQFAYLLQKLDDRPDAGGGSLLDNTLVFWTKNIGWNHSGTKMLYMLAGGGVGDGRFISRTGVPHNNLLLTICHLMGLDDDSFGDPDICTGALTL